MNTFKEIKLFLREKSGKKLAAFSLIVFLFITAIVFFAVLRFYGLTHINQMDEYLSEIPNIIDRRINELTMRSRVYKDDFMTRAELGAKIYSSENETLTDLARLEHTRNTISADSVSLLNEQRELLYTTGHVSPEENFRACINALEPHSLYLETYPAVSKDGEKTGETDGKCFVMLPVSGNNKHSLVFEFSCDGLLELYNALDDWEDILEVMLARRDVVAFAKHGDTLSCFPADDFPAEDTTRIDEELTKIFAKTTSLWKTESKRPV